MASTQPVEIRYRFQLNHSGHQWYLMQSFMVSPTRRRARPLETDGRAGAISRDLRQVLAAGEAHGVVARYGRAGRLGWARRLGIPTRRGRPPLSLDTDTVDRRRHPAGRRGSSVRCGSGYSTVNPWVSNSAIDGRASGRAVSKAAFRRVMSFAWRTNSPWAGRTPKLPACG